LGTEGNEINIKGKRALNNKNIFVLLGRNIIEINPIKKGANMTRGTVMKVKTQG
jgi:hypothetical protein